MTVASQIGRALAEGCLPVRAQPAPESRQALSSGELGKAINSSLDLDNVLDYIINIFLSSISRAESELRDASWTAALDAARVVYSGPRSGPSRR